MDQQKKIGKLTDKDVKDYNLTCPLCGKMMILRNSKYGLFYSCSNWPNCSCKHGAHQATGKPLGTPADKDTRACRIRTHAEFDKLWKGPTKIMSRKDAYSVVAREMHIPSLHISSFDKAQCLRLISFLQLKSY